MNTQTESIAQSRLRAVAIVFGALAVFTAIGDAASTADARDPAKRPVIGLEHQGPIRVVYQVTKDEWQEDAGKALVYLKKLRGYYAKQGVDPKLLDIRAVFHGDASAHLLTDEAYNRVKETDTGNPNTKLIAELAKVGVHLELCDSRRREEGWAMSDIHPDVLLAEAAFARIIDLQLRGYAYIRF